MIDFEIEIKKKIEEVADHAHLSPCVNIVHLIKDASVVWMCNKGLSQLNISLNELTKMSAETYYSRFFNIDDANDINPKILGLLERNNDDETVSFFQQVRVNHHTKWTWHISSTKILYRDKSNVPILIITQSMPIDGMHIFAQKAARILEENNFLRENYHLFTKLTNREKEILKHLAKGESSIDCGKSLFISPQTVDTHRKNIRKKLRTNSFQELSKYARSFDLI